MLELPAPLNSDDPQDWAEYADFLMEIGDQRGPDVLAIRDTLLAYAERKADARRLLLLRPRHLPGQPRLGYVLFRPDRDRLNSVQRYPTRLWINLKGATTYYRLPAPVEQHLTRPWDIPELVEGYPDLVWAYFRRLTADAVMAGWVKKTEFMG